MPDARVMMTSRDVDLPDIAALSDHRGEVRLGAFKNAEYRITCTAEGFETTSRTITVGSEDTFEAVVTLVR
ncbi:carboxypeptidase-like regulatory domain-containing protein [Leisingera sp. M527]|nr:carboxypeptidase-like regulatory domain-containing protein [Leisingera sp. M527]